MRLIDADALLEEVIGITDGWLKPSKDWRWYEDSIRSAPTVGGWISVKDRLPDIGQRVLVYAITRDEDLPIHQTIELCLRYVLRGTELWREPWPYFNEDYKITHWMPLPPSPKEILND